MTKTTQLKYFNRDSSIIISIFRVFFLLFIINTSSNAQCTITFQSYASARSQTDVDFTVSDPTAGTKTFYIEYGLAGFTPGTNATPGVGGTIVTLTFSGTSIGTSRSGLTPSTTYDVYTRKNCSGTSFSLNSPKQSFFTFPNCSNSTALPCGQVVNPVFPAGYGAWNLACQGIGKELLYTFTASTTGNHRLTLNPSATSVTYFWSGNFGANCTAGTFNCIGTNNPTTTSTYSLYFTAGTSYVIMAKPNTTAGGSFGSFRFDCLCPAPTNVFMSTITQYSARIFYTGSSVGDIIEYGPGLFTPGTGATAGVGGTVTSGFSGKLITGLTPGQSYSIYVRNLCAGGNNYGLNSSLVYFQTIACPQIYPVPYSPLGSPISIGSVLGSHLNSAVNYSCNGDTLQYLETFVKFTPPVTGMYTLQVYGALPTEVFLGYRPTNNSCDFSNFNYICPWGANGNYDPIGPLTAGVTYDISAENVNSWGGTFGLSINCADPSGVTKSNVQMHSATISFSCSCPNVSYIEYGPTGFTPGTGATAGGGTLVTGTSPYDLTSLTDNTSYDVYVRNFCGGTSFSNNVLISFRTLIDCANAPVITCGTSFTHSEAKFEYGNWNNYGCGTTVNSGNEKIFRFTPLQTGAYKLRCIQNYGWQLGVSTYYKLASGTCDATGWSCLGSLSIPNDSLTTGILQANTTYLFLFDQQGGSTFFTKTFQIDCAVACNTAPATPGTITGNARPCPGDTASVYSVVAVTNATTYNWTVPSGVTITSGAGTRSIKINYAPTFVSGTISITSSNACGTSLAKTKGVSKNIPAYPSAINGPAYGVCSGGTATYSISAINNTTTYLWTVPSGAIINSGQGSTSISVSFPTPFVSGNITVAGGTSCGYGTARTVSVRSTPTTPLSITGPAAVCANQLGVNYSTPLISSAISYTWVVPSGSSIISGQGTSAIIMNYGATGGNVKVKGVNGCGAGYNFVLPVTIVCRESVSSFVSDLDISIYPNPSNTTFTINPHFNNEGTYSLIIRDILGRIVEQYSELDSKNLFVFGKLLPNGIYITEVIKGNKRTLIKLVKSN